MLEQMDSDSCGDLHYGDLFCELAPRLTRNIAELVSRVGVFGHLEPPSREKLLDLVRWPIINSESF